MVTVTFTLPLLSITTPLAAIALSSFAPTTQLDAGIATWGVQAETSLGQSFIPPALPVNRGPTMSAMWKYQRKSMGEKFESTWSHFFDFPFHRSIREREVASLLRVARCFQQQSYLAKEIYSLLQHLGIAPGLVSPRAATQERWQHYPLLWNGLELVLLVRKLARTSEKEAYAIVASPAAGHVLSVLKVLRGYLFNPKEDRTAAGNIAQIISYYENLLSEEELAQFRVFQGFFKT